MRRSILPGNGLVRQEIPGVNSSIRIQTRLRLGKLSHYRFTLRNGLSTL